MPGPPSGGAPFVLGARDERGLKNAAIAQWRPAVAERRGIDREGVSNSPARMLASALKAELFEGIIATTADTAAAVRRLEYGGVACH
jgi:hypothetical protein